MMVCKVGACAWMSTDPLMHYGSAAMIEAWRDLYDDHKADWCE